MINRTGNLIDVQGGFPHGTPYTISQIAWPALAPGVAAMDADADGMPDEWELSNKLNPKNATDASAYTLNKNYTNIEILFKSNQQTIIMKFFFKLTCCRYLALELWHLLYMIRG